MEHKCAMCFILDRIFKKCRIFDNITQTQMELTTQKKWVLLSDFNDTARASFNSVHLCVL